MKLYSLSFCGAKKRARAAIHHLVCSRSPQLASVSSAIVILLVLTLGIRFDAFALEGREKATHANDLFTDRCKRSGEFIHRTFEDVDGIFLLKVRPNYINTGKSKSDQYALDDPYGRDLGGDGYIISFIQGSYQASASGTAAPGSPPRLGYSFVDAIDPKDGARYRYTGLIEEPWQIDKRYLKGYLRFVMKKEVAPPDQPRFGITYDDISTREERDYWIAGSSLKIIDLQTNEVIAERIGYMMDRGQGSKAAGRSPWLFAADTACPSFYRNPKIPQIGFAANAQHRQTQDFVEKVLKPRMKIVQ